MPNAYVVGLGKSGIAAAHILKREGWEVTVSDRQTSESLQKQQQQLENQGIKVQLGHSLELSSPDSPQPLPQLIVVSPGVPWDAPPLVAARKLGIETIGEMELAWRHLHCPWVGITGTNGKTTTTALIATIFQGAGLNAPACGNIGYAACELALTASTPQTLNPKPQTPNSELRTPNFAPSPLDWVIAEISSYQIESSYSISPHIGIWTTFTPDHLSRHKTLENYYSIKAHLLLQSHLQIFNGDDAYLSQVGVNNWRDAYWTSVNGKEHLVGKQGVYIQDGWVVDALHPPAAPEQIVPVAALRMPGKHNQQNLLMAVAAARLAGIDKAAIAQAIASFPGVPHRLEHICTWRGIDFINDSKATNYDAAQVGLASVASPVILIAGGEAKTGDDTSWIETIRAKAAAVLLIGNAASTFAQRLEPSGANYEIVETMERAVPRAAELAQQYRASVVLLSPACASFDQYQNFEQRGDHFRELCEHLHS